MNNNALQNKKALIIGTTGDGPKFAFGGSDKIKGLKEILSGLYKSVSIANTAGWKRHPFKAFRNVKKGIVGSDDIYIVLSTNGTRYLCPFIVKIAKKHRARLIYAMVGIGSIQTEVKCPNDWDKLTELIQEKSLWHSGSKRISRILSKMDVVLVEANRLKEMVERFYGLNNVFVLANARDYDLPSSNQINTKQRTKTSFVYFATVSRAKGFGLLLDAVNLLNDKGVSNFEVDVYGRIAEEDDAWFKSLVLPSNVNYKGVCLVDKISTLSQYDCLVFPSTSIEGMPGTIVDARFAGIPVIASTFTFADEMIQDGQDGFLFQRKNSGDLADKMENFVSIQDISALKENSGKRAREYTSSFSQKEILAVLCGGSAAEN